MKTAELTGALLDYWVAKAEGMTPRRVYPDEFEWFDDATGTCIGGTEDGGSSEYAYSPSTKWQHGGPIIEREEITLLTPKIYGYITEWTAVHNARYGPNDYEIDGTECTAPTPLIAAMRSYVASKFGDAVPDDPTA